MRTIGVLGGMTWHSSAEYYRLINELAHERLGGSHAARCVLFSVDAASVEELMLAERWDEAGTMLAADASAVERAGADVFVLGCNSLHHVWDTIVAPLSIPSIHIGDAAASALAGRERVLLLGTQFTMELPWLRERLEARGIEVLVPEAPDREEIQRTIFAELSHGSFTDATRAWYVELVSRFDVDAVVLACSEIGLLLRADDVAVPLVDTVHAHAQAVVAYAYDV
ncbi:MAG TPA: amino acid racemase [Gaiellaceae bacterium]|nr:amino acid racemase [Gaiellaceae bacterium]